MRRTKSFSYEPKQERVWRILEREARLERRTLSSQLFYILDDFFERKRMLREIQNSATETDTGIRTEIDGNTVRVSPAGKGG